MRSPPAPASAEFNVSTKKSFQHSHVRMDVSQGSPTSEISSPSLILVGCVKLVVFTALTSRLLLSSCISKWSRTRGLARV